MKLKLKVKRPEGKTIDYFKRGDILECVTPMANLNDGSAYMLMESGSLLQLTGVEAGQRFEAYSDVFIPAELEVID